MGDKMSSIFDKYLSSDKKKKKRNQLKGGVKGKKFKGGGMRIFDDDGFGDSKIDISDDETAEELPQIAAVVDERPREVQLLDEIKQGKWKQLEKLKEKKGDSGSGDRATNQTDNSSSEDEDEGRQRRRHDSEGDSDDSQRRRRRVDSDGDVSPPRRKRHDSDESPPRRNRKDSDGDISPPRQRKRYDNDNESNRGDLSPSRRRQRHDSDGSSPPRTRKRVDSDDDLSPPRARKRHDSGDLSPPRRQTKPGHDRRRREDDDLSPPRNSGSYRDSRRGGSPQGRYGRHHQSTSNNSRRPIANPEIIDAPNNSVMATTTLDGKKAGLQRASDLRNEMVDYRKRENEMFDNLDDDVSGRNAVTKFRDRTTGRERDLRAEMAKKEEDDKLLAEKKKLYEKWGKGLKQVEEQATRLNEALHEVSKPLARYSDDQDLDDYLKHQERDGDPMLKFLTSKKKGAYSSKPAYQGPPPMPNRFAIPPGHRWDGVDRSGGYEKEWFSRINERKALHEEAYKWSVEDL